MDTTAETKSEDMILFLPFSSTAIHQIGMLIIFAAAELFKVHEHRKKDAFNVLVCYVFNRPNFWLSKRISRVYNTLGTLLQPDSRKF